MKRILFVGLFLIGILALVEIIMIHKKPILDYYVDLNQRDGNLFHVKLNIIGLGQSDTIYQFAATSPGTYSVLDIGRFVKRFKAFDGKGDSLTVKHVSVNKWRIEKPQDVRQVVYIISETNDPGIKEHVVVRYAGSSIGKDHALIAGHAVFGYFERLLKSPISIRIDYPKGWLTGTALDVDKDGVYHVRSYDELVDNPFLLGRLSKAEFSIDDTKVNIYTYSETDKIKAMQLSKDADTILMAAKAFMIKIPVNRYTFLFNFQGESNMGALEHSYCSLFTYEDKDYGDMRQELKHAMQHEFTHLVTPLRIRSEIIDNFDYESPKASEHLWFYEGVTEWETNVMQMRYKSMDINVYLSDLTAKVNRDELYFDPGYSLRQIGVTVYTEKGNAQKYNMYNRGAVTAGLLDIKLLELSGGKRGLREVLNEFVDRYKPGKPFNDNDFFKTFVKMTYPEIGDFFDKYVINATPLPLASYYEKLGIKYVQEVSTGKISRGLGIVGVDTNDNKISLRGITKEGKMMGFQEDDELIELNKHKVTASNIGDLAAKLLSFPGGTEYEVKIIRDRKNKVMICKILESGETLRNQFFIDSACTKKQKELRGIWMRNM